VTVSAVNGRPRCYTLLRGQPSIVDRTAAVIDPTARYSLGGLRQNIAITFGMEKLEWRGHPIVKNFEDMFILFDRIHESDGRTGRQTVEQTDTARRHRPRLCRASRGKNV